MAEKFSGSIVDLSRDDYFSEITHNLGENGYSRFETMYSPAELVGLARQMGRIILHRDGDADGVTKVAPREIDPTLTSQLGLTDQELKLHTDGSAIEHPAVFLVLYCETKAETGGATRMLDGKILYDTLAQLDPELLAKLQTPGSATFGDPNGEHHTGSILSSKNGLVSVRFRADGGATYDNLTTRELDTLVAIMDSVADEFMLEEGQGYIVNNRRSLHAREGFGGYRAMQRVLVVGDGREIGVEAGFRIHDRAA